jgi:hypothetical protein
MQCDYAVIMSFSKQEIPLLACGDNKGNINFWDLNEKKIFSSIKGAH